MSAPIADRYRRWFEYERDAHDRVFSSFETVPAERRDSPEFRKAVSVMAHVVAARRVWLTRLGAAPASPGALFPEGLDPSQVADDWRPVQEAWGHYLGSLTDEELAREVEYQSLDAGRFRSRLEDILAQLFGHSWYHRGQVAMLVRAAGGEPAPTDFIYWSREPIPIAGV